MDHKQKNKKESIRFIFGRWGQGIENLKVYENSLHPYKGGELVGANHIFYSHFIGIIIYKRGASMPCSLHLSNADCLILLQSLK